MRELTVKHEQAVEAAAHANESTHAQALGELEAQVWVPLDRIAVYFNRESSRSPFKL